MAGTKRPSFLKSQKEQKRKLKAQEKREARLNKRVRAAEASARGEEVPEFGVLEHDPASVVGADASDDSPDLTS